MHHNISNQDIYLPPIALNKPINSILGYNLPQPFPRTFPDQLIPSMFLENSLDIQNILLHGNSVKIPSFPQQCREDAQSATSSSEWIDTEERYPIDLSRLSQNMEKSALNRLFSPGNSEDFYITEPMNIEYLKLLSQAQDGDFSRVLGLSKASKKIVKNSTNHNHHINGIHDEKNQISIKNRPSLEASRKLRFNKLRTKRNPWRPSEDSKLLELVEVYGESWAMISSKLPNRTGKQIRDRFLNILRPNLKKGEWTLQEDALLMALSHKIGHKWSSIAKHMPGRSEAQVKNRFYSHIKKRLEGGKGAEEEVISIPRFEPSSAASFLAESTEMEGEGSRRWAEEENCGEASVKLEENEKKKIKEEHGWETKVEAEDMKMHTEHHKQPARKILGERKLDENSVSERDNEWIGLELPQNSAEGSQRSQHKGKNVTEHSVQKKVVPVEKCGQKIVDEGSKGMKVSPGKGQQKVGPMENEVENKTLETSRVNRRGPINEKEVDLVIGILARYYQNSDKREAQQDSNKMETENAIVDKAKRLQQLDVRKTNLELLLIKTMEEMDKIQQK